MVIDWQRCLRLFRAAQLRAIRRGNVRMADMWAKNIVKVKERISKSQGV